MKTVLIALVAITTLASSLPASAAMWGHHRHQVCTWSRHHHHRHCDWR